VLVETENVTPQERLSSRLERAIGLRSAGEMDGATVELEEALAEARLKPYEVKFQTRVRLANMLTGAYLSTGGLERAREMLAEESDYAEKIFSLIAATGSVAEKRMANADRVQIRDLAVQVNLIGKPAPEISVGKWINSEPQSLEALRGHVVLLEFWATWCKPCHEMFPKLRELHETQSERGLRVLALTRHYLAYGGDERAREEELTLVRAFVAEREVAFPVGVSDDERTQTLYGATGLPAVALIDRQGIVRYRFGGGGDRAFQQILEECLDEKAAR
jgi:cytochrome c biogenesis protein CcmG/thiol:disulfide interchange protein DsbE